MREQSLLGVGRPGQPGKKCAELSSKCIWDIFIFLILKNVFFSLKVSSFVGGDGRKQAAKQGQEPPWPAWDCSPS